MKYTQQNPPLICMQTNSTCYKQTKKMVPKGILIHSTGAPNPYLKRYIQPSDNDKNYETLLKILGVNKNKNDWNHIVRQAGLNAWIGKDDSGEVRAVQSMPWEYQPWGCGSGAQGSCNDSWIQFEICEPTNLYDSEYFNKIYMETCELVAYLCNLFNIDPKGTVTYKGKSKTIQVPTILCHYDSYKLGLGSGHKDIEHWFPLHGKSIETVREDVNNLLVSNTTIKSPTLGEKVDLMVKTIVSLNCRKNPSPSAQFIKTFAPNTTLHIIEKYVNNWGKVENTGWVNLSYTTPIEEQKEEEEMTQSQFNSFMDNYLLELANKSPSEWSQGARLWAESAGIILGDENGNKQYKKFVTREELAQILYRALNTK